MGSMVVAGLKIEFNHGNIFLIYKMFTFNAKINNTPLTFTVTAKDNNYTITTALDETKYEGATQFKSVGRAGIANVQKLIEYVVADITVKKMNTDIVMVIPVPFSDEKIGVTLHAEQVSEVEMLRRQVKKLTLQNAECVARMQALERKINKPVFTLETLLELSRYIEGMGDDHITFSVRIGKSRKQSMLNIINGMDIVKLAKWCVITFSFNSNAVKNSRKVLGDIVDIIRADFDDDEHNIRKDISCAGQHNEYYTFTGEITMASDLNELLNIGFAIELMEDRYPYMLLSEMDTYMKNHDNLNYAIYINLYNRHGIVDQKNKINQTIEKYRNL